MDDFRHDLRGALRSLSRRPAYATLVIVTLAVGLGASAAMFSVVDGVLLTPLPFDQPERLVLLERTRVGDPSHTNEAVSPPDLLDLATARSLDELVGYSPGSRTLMRDGEPMRLRVGNVTDGLLSAFGLTPHLGRDLAATDAVLDAEEVVVLGYDLWRRDFGADPSILGRRIELTSGPATVVGVAPPGFRFPQEADAWTAFQIDPEGCGRGCHMFGTVGRLAEGATVESASGELETMSAALEAEYPDTNTDKRYRAASLQAHEVAPVRTALWVLLGAVQLVLAIAAVNVANLVLVRGARRRRELAIRAALGAGRLRLFRQLMLESSLLALGGAVAGIVFGQLLLVGFLHLAPDDLPRLETVALDGSAVAFTAGLSFLVLLIFGFVPSLRMARVDLRDRGQVGSVDGRRSRQLLLTAEVALALLLLLGAGLLMRSFVALTEVDLGFESERLTRFTLALPEMRYPEGTDRVLFAERLEEELLAVPGIDAAGLAFSGPFGASQIVTIVEPLDRPTPPPGQGLTAVVELASPGFFEAFGVSAVRGRVFNDADDRSTPRGLVVSQTFADRYYPDREVLGARLKAGVDFGFDEAEEPLTVLGVVPDLRYSLTDEPQPTIYLAQAQTGSSYLAGFVRSRGDQAVASTVRDVLRGLDATLLPGDLVTQKSAIGESYGSPRFYLALLVAFAGIALVLAAVGLYGVVAFLVAQRTRELAVRMALGADRGDVLSLVLRDALRPAVAGVALGLLASVAGVRLLESLLFGVEAYDAMTFVAAPVVLLTVALLATLAPARRAARLEPRTALEEA